MIVRRSIAPALLKQLGSFSSCLPERVEASRDDPAHANVHDYLAVQSELPHESILRWIDLQLPDAPIGAIEAGHHDYVAQQLDLIDVKSLPADLGWAVARCRDHDSGTSGGLRAALRVVHACTSENVALACKLQPLIDQMDAHLVRIGCARREVPMIIGLPRSLDQSLRHGRMSTTRGMCTWSGVHALAMLDVAVGGLIADTGFARAELEHTLVHEMIHASQSLGKVGSQHIALVEGLTEMAVQQLGMRTDIGVYDSELALAHAVRDALHEDIGLGARSTHDVPGLFERAKDEIEEQELRYALSPDARFVTYAIASRLRWMASGIADQITWRVDPGEDIEQLALAIGQVHSHQGNALRDPKLRAAALMVWAAHVMGESAVRAFAWLGSEAGDRQTELDSIVRWRKNETALAWLRELASRTHDYSFWAQAAYLGVDADHELLMSQWPSLRDKLAERDRQVAA